MAEMVDSMTDTGPAASPSDQTRRLVALGAYLRSHRELLGLTQSELARRTGLDVHVISRMERGANPRPAFEEVGLIAYHLSLPIWRLADLLDVPVLGKADPRDDLGPRLDRALDDIRRFARNLPEEKRDTLALMLRGMLHLGSEAGELAVTKETDAGGRRITRISYPREQ